MMVGVVARERRRQQPDSRSWALMEPLFLGAVLLYAIVIVSNMQAIITRKICNCFFFFKN
jgi:hypothetical protein